MTRTIKRFTIVITLIMSFAELQNAQGADPIPARAAKDDPGGGAGDGGTVLDLSASNLDRVEGQGNEFKIKWSGTAKRVIYPGGGTVYNLAAGNQLWIDGRLQSVEKPKVTNDKKP